ncbi:MAG: NUDIX domain-containing protein [bacterium]|nr:NUDIX domain-containing protein [bacterium]
MGQDDQSFFVGLKAFLGKDGNLLILQDHEGFWELPGGKIKKSEDVESAFRREVAEELGSQVEFSVQGILHSWIRKPHPDKDFVLFLVGLKCTYERGEIILSKEHKNFKWIDESDIDGLQFENTYEDAVRYYFKSS